MRLGPRILLITGIFTVFVSLAAFRGYQVFGDLGRERVALLERTEWAKLLAMKAQVAFKTQVQEWKNVLLRGSDAADYRRYLEQFLAQQDLTQELVRQLGETVPPDSQARDVALRFLESHRDLAKRYQEGLTAFEGAGRTDPFAIDKMVRGIDREPTELFLQMLTIIDRESDEALQAMAREQKAFFTRTLAMIVGMVLLGFGILVWCLQRWISLPVLAATEMAREIASDKLSTLMKVTTSSELGELQSSLNQMQAHLRETRDELLRANRELSAARDEALAASAAKSRFLANVSHELRTPLNGVIGMSSLLMDVPLDDEAREIADTILKSGRLLSKLINDVLDFSKLEADRMVLENIPFELESLLEEVMALAASRSPVDNLYFGFWISPDVLPVVTGDRVRLQQILNNLVSNAVKFTPDGAVEIHVDRLSADDRGHLQFSVLDTGIGISPEKEEAIFDLFTQEDDSTTRRFGGTGLGLPICRKLVEIMGGRIDVKPRSPRGSCFYFDVKFPAASSVQVSPGPMVRPALGQTRRVWLLMENTIVRRSTAGLLNRWGWEPWASDNPDLVVARTEENLSTPSKSPAVLICDEVLIERMNSTAWAILRRAADRQIMVLVICRRMGRKDPVTVDQIPAVPDRTLFQPVTRLGLAALLQYLSSPREKPHDQDKGGASPVAEGKPFSSLRTLVAEDNPVNTLLVQKILRKMGIDPVCAPDGVAAIEAYEKEPFDLILMDINMPRLDGEQAANEIRKLASGIGRQPRIIVLTANVREGDREHYLALGMDDYLRKPLTKDDLIAALLKQFPHLSESRTSPDSVQVSRGSE